jgi:glycosyltransferase involved in cell wall biosynthesis
VLTVLGVAFPFSPVKADPVGGAEHVLGCIDARLVADGHRSIVLAAAGSRGAGETVTIPAPSKAEIDRDEWFAAHDAYRRELARLLAEREIDVVHFHGVDFIDYVPETDVPIVATLHVPRSWYKPHALTSTRVRRVCVSRTHRATFAPDVDVAAVVENGVDLERYAPTHDKRPFALALGRICPEKGFEHALRAAKLARVPLAVAGSVFPYKEHERYAREVLAPLTDDARRLVGPIAGDRKRALLAQARCLVVTSLVEETSSIVAMEALASGTPVVGFARGALPEIVDDGVTGFLVGDPEELPGAIDRAARLDARACRAAAEGRFSARRMTEQYVELYRSAARARLGVTDSARPRPDERPNRSPPP